MGNDGRTRSFWNFSGTTIIGTVSANIHEPKDFSGLLVKRLYLRNSGPATFTSGSLEHSPDGNNWWGYDGTTAQTLGSAGSALFLIQNDSAPFWRLRASVASGSVATCNFWWTF